MDRPETRRLPCELTRDEILERGTNLSEKIKVQENVEGERKDIMAQFKARQETLVREICEISEQIRTKREYRDVEVKRSKDWERNVEEVYRCDTGEIVIGETRALTPGERQEHLDFKEGGKMANMGSKVLDEYPCSQCGPKAIEAGIHDHVPEKPPPLVASKEEAAARVQREAERLESGKGDGQTSSKPLASFMNPKTVKKQRKGK